MLPTPAATDIYSRVMVEAFDERDVIGVSTVWQSFFGKPAHGNSKSVFSPDDLIADIDVIRANERTAKFVARDTDSRSLNGQLNTATQNFTSFSRRYPLCEEIGDISAGQINKRTAGESAFNGMARAGRLQKLALEHHKEHIRRYVRLFEVLCGMSLLDGMHPAINNAAVGDTDAWYDFRRNAANIITPTIPWNAAGADPLADIDAGCRVMRENGKVQPNVIFFGQNVFPVFIEDLKVVKYADTRRYELIEISTYNPVPPQLNDLVAGGAIPRGILRTPEGFQMYMFTYIDIFTDETGAHQPYMPHDSVFMAYYGARCDRMFGPSEIMPITSVENAWYREMLGMDMMSPVMPAGIKNPSGIVVPQMFYCDAYPSADRKKISVRTQSAPIYATTQTDAFVTFTNVLERSS